MSKVDYLFMERFKKRPLEEQLRVFKQNLKQMQGEEEVDLRDNIAMCRAEIEQLKKTKEQNGTPQET